MAGFIRLFIVVALFAGGGSTLAGAQIRTIPIERLDSIANPVHAKGSEAMVFENKTIRTGSIDQDDTPSYDFRWRNEGAEPLVITRVQTTCSCVTASYNTSPVAPSGNGTVTVKYLPKGRPGSFNRRIFVYTQLSETEPSAVLELKGAVAGSGPSEDEYPIAMGALRLKTKTLNFAGDRLQAERIECFNTGTVPMNVTVNRYLIPEGITFSCEPATIGPGETADLVVSFNPVMIKRTVPKNVPLILEGPAVPPGQRTLELKFE